MTANWGHVEKITREVGGRTHTFKSKLEARWAVWCQLRKEQGIIVDWEYESVEVKVETKTGDIMTYRPDFTILKPCVSCERSGKDYRLALGYSDPAYAPPEAITEIPCPKCDGFGDTVEYEETKGWFTSKDYTKMKLMSEQYDNPLTLIFANLTNSKSARAQYGRAKRLEKLLESNGGRIIYDANKSIFRKIKHLFDC